VKLIYIKYQSGITILSFQCFIVFIKKFNMFIEVSSINYKNNFLSYVNSISSSRSLSCSNSDSYKTTVQIIHQISRQAWRHFRMLRVLWWHRCDNKRYSLSHLCPRFWCPLWINCAYQTITFLRKNGPARYSQVLSDRFAHPNDFFQRLEFNLLWTLGHFDRSHSVLSALWQAVCEPWINIIEGSITKQFTCIQ